MLPGKNFSISWSTVFGKHYSTYTHILYISDSQPGCRKKVSGVPPNLKLLPFLFMLYYIECQKLSFLTQQVCRQIFLRPKGCREPKRLKNTALHTWTSNISMNFCQVQHIMPESWNRSQLRLVHLKTEVGFACFLRASSSVFEDENVKFISRILRNRL